MGSARRPPGALQAKSGGIHGFAYFRKRTPKPAADPGMCDTIANIRLIYGQRKGEGVARTERIVLGIDPGLANTGWGIVSQQGSRLVCLAYGCVSTDAATPLAQRLRIIHEQVGAVIERYRPACVGIETVWFGQNITAAFATGQARGAALVACAEGNLDVGEFTPRQIKMAVVGTGSAEKDQVQYMVRKLLALDHDPKPDHASDALAAAICYTTHDGLGGGSAASGAGARASRGRAGAQGSARFDALVAAALEREQAHDAAPAGQAAGLAAARERKAASQAVQHVAQAGVSADEAQGAGNRHGSAARRELLAKARGGKR